MSDNHDPYAVPPGSLQAEPYSYAPAEPIPSAADALAAPEPLVAAEPLPAMAGG